MGGDCGRFRARRTLRLCALVAAALVGVLAAPAAGGALGPRDTARVLAGLDPAPAGLSAHAAQMIQPYAKAVGERWQEYDRRIGEPMRAWGRAELEQGAGEVVFYPFSGPDFPSAHQFYPDAGRYVLVAIQRADPPPPLDRYSPQELSAFLAMFRTAWERFSRLGFFLTKDLDADQSQPGIRIGVTALLMAFAARSGYDVVAVDPVRINDDGTDLEPHPGDRANRSTWESARLTLARGGRTIVVDYVRLDLSDSNLARRRAPRAWIESVAAHRTILKAASHLPQHPHFSVVRNAILAGAPSICQDETGIEFAMLAERFAVTLHGRFTKPHRLFSAGAQRSLALAYEQGPRSKALPFRLGYEKESGSTVQVAVRDAAGPGARRGEHTQAQARPARPAAPSTRAAAPSAPPAEVVIQALEARIAEQIRRAEKRPRKAFVGGRTDETPYAGYVQGVRERLAGAAPPGRPAKPSVVSVAIAPDGSINALDHDRGSGSATYDRRVRAAVQEAAPFPPLPDDIRRRADLLVISFQFPDP